MQYVYTWETLILTGVAFLELLLICLIQLLEMLNGFSRNRGRPALSDSVNSFLMVKTFAYCHHDQILFLQKIIY